MELILKYLENPPWWFIVIVGPVTIWAFGILKDAVSRWLARSSSWYRQLKAQTLARKEREVEFLSSDPAILTLYNSETSTMLMYGLFFLLFFILSLVCIQSILSANEGFLTLPPYSRSIYMLEGVVLVIVSSLMTTVLGFISGVRIAVGARAYRRIYKRKLAEFERRSNTG